MATEPVPFARAEVKTLRGILVILVLLSAGPAREGEAGALTDHTSTSRATIPMSRDRSSTLDAESELARHHNAPAALVASLGGRDAVDDECVHWAALGGRLNRSPSAFGFSPEEYDPIGSIMSGGRSFVNRKSTVEHVGGLV